MYMTRLLNAKLPTDLCRMSKTSTVLLTSNSYAPHVIKMQLPAMY